MSSDIRQVTELNGLINYFVDNLNWNINVDDFEDIEDITYDFTAKDIGLKEESFAKIISLKELPPLVDGQKWGIFSVEFDSRKFEVTALRKILSGLIPKKRNSTEHAVWSQQNLLFICFWGEGNNRTIGIAHFEENESGLPQIRMISCAPAVEDFTQIDIFKHRLELLRWPQDERDTNGWHDTWSLAFTTGFHQIIKDSSTLTNRLAEEARGIRNRILDILEIESQNGYVHLLYDKFCDMLVHDMSRTQFADMYAQTVVYGLFSARCMDNTPDDFSTIEAVKCIPITNPFLKSLMEDCVGINSKNQFFDELEISNVVELLKHTQMVEMLKDFNRQTGGGKEDPVIHFYEEFLAAYDKAQKVQRGVYYTPQPVVAFMVRAVDDILKSEFKLSDGLASTDTKTINIKRLSKKRINGQYVKVDDTKEIPRVQILDPATGTGTFIRQIIIQIYKDFSEKYSNTALLQKKWNEYVPDNLLGRITGFELMMAPYAVAHMKLAMILKQCGYNFASDKRLQVYLTNTLEEPKNSTMQMTLFDDPLATESIEANIAKKNEGINIVIGNPPYSGESANKNEYIMKLMEDYKKEPGGVIKLQERNPKWINDDYVKFIRYAQSVIERAGTGILAYICPHGFLDNPTFRGMRWQLLRSFQKMYIINLHGNAKKREVAPDGSKDENVFDIQQGVCIIIAIRNTYSLGLGKIYYSDLYGLREHKYNLLNRARLSQIQFAIVEPQAPQYFFIPKDFSLQSEYDKFTRIEDIFSKKSVGIVSAKDKILIDFDKAKLLEKVSEYYETEAKESLCKKISYRPFDDRYIYYDTDKIGRSREEITQNFQEGVNIGLCLTKVLKSGNSYYNCFVSNKMIDSCFVSNRTSEITYIFPLYTYYDLTERHPNIKDDYISALEQVLSLKYNTNIDDISNHECFSALDIWDYIYSILNCSYYRKRYIEFLKIDFPRIPLPVNKESFIQLANCGAALRRLHTEKQSVGSSIEFCGCGDNTISHIKYCDNKVFINSEQYFANIYSQEWNFIIGAYNVSEKWLKDKKGRILTNENIDEYISNIEVIRKTICIREQIDEIFQR